MSERDSLVRLLWRLGYRISRAASRAVQRRGTGTRETRDRERTCARRRETSRERLSRGAARRLVLRYKMTENVIRHRTAPFFTLYMYSPRKRNPALTRPRRSTVLSLTLSHLGKQYGNVAPMRRIALLGRKRPNILPAICAK